jgi:hypothetical protein
MGKRTWTHECWGYAYDLLQGLYAETPSTVRGEKRERGIGLTFDTPHLIMNYNLRVRVYAQNRMDREYHAL